MRETAAQATTTQEDRTVSNTQETAAPTLAEAQDAADAAWDRWIAAEADAETANEAEQAWLEADAADAAWEAWQATAEAASAAREAASAAREAWEQADAARIAAEEADAEADAEWGGC